ncbi:MAG: hypothetical protein EZS28_042708 [Streblomastix strix]|uniref:Uncharacterized protein n=1 Tax=Streblomastix strix TaxID=222440 RepID=A0A5J4TWJ6_9EUKA|nr:MAG: hypothetical protein EZS28_042708 [Streblomastix strix]
MGYQKILYQLADTPNLLRPVGNVCPLLLIGYDNGLLAKSVADSFSRALILSGYVIRMSGVPQYALAASWADYIIIQNIGSSYYIVLGLGMQYIVLCPLLSILQYGQGILVDLNLFQ